jgi:hypothetical protein
LAMPASFISTLASPGPRIEQSAIVPTWCGRRTTKHRAL